MFPADHSHCALTHLKSPNVFVFLCTSLCAFPPWLHMVFSTGSTSFNIYSLLINADLEKGEVQSWIPPREVTRSLPQWLLSPGPWCYWHHCLSPLYEDPSWPNGCLDSLWRLGELKQLLPLCNPHGHSPIIQQAHPFLSKGEKEANTCDPWHSVTLLSLTTIKVINYITI